MNGNTATIKPFVFVLMPFDQCFDDIYQLGIKSACNEAGAYCERVDEQIFEESILDRIYNQIAKADVVVSDMTGKNPNVFYETGYAHALGKKVILLTQRAEDIPFDLKHYPHIIYSGKITELKSQLIKRIQWCFENPQESLESVEPNFELFIKGQLVIDGLETVCEIFHVIDVDVPGGSFDYPYISINLDIHNPSEKMYKGLFNIGLITSDFNKNDSNYKVVSLPDQTFMHLIQGANQMLPKSWESFKIKLRIPFEDEYQSYEFKIRTYTELGMIEKRIALKTVVI